MADPKAPPPVQKKGPGVLLVLTAVFMVLLSVGAVAWAIPLTPCPTCKAQAPAVAVEPPKEAAPCADCKSAAVTVDRFKDGVCPTCKGAIPAPGAAVAPVRPPPCITCKGEGKVSLLRKWVEKRVKVDLDLKLPSR
jgi:hypothetical protein